MRKAWSEAFLGALRESPNIAAACRAVGITRQCAYAYRKEDPDFAGAWEEAIEEAVDNLVGEVYRRAMVGTERPVFYQGAQCGTVREFSDSLAVMLLKAHRPGVYGDRAKHEHEGEMTIRVEYVDALGDREAGEVDEFVGGKLVATSRVPPRANDD